MTIYKQFPKEKCVDEGERLKILLDTYNKLESELIHLMTDTTLMLYRQLIFVQTELGEMSHQLLMKHIGEEIDEFKKTI